MGLKWFVEMTHFMNQYLESRKKIGAGLAMMATTNTSQMSGHEVGSMWDSPAREKVNHMHQHSVTRKNAGICTTEAGRVS